MRTTFDEWDTLLVGRQDCYKPRNFHTVFLVGPTRRCKALLEAFVQVIVRAAASTTPSLPMVGDVPLTFPKNATPSPHRARHMRLRTAQSTLNGFVGQYNYPEV